MRLAVIVASSYPKSSVLPRLPVAEVDGRRMAERLTETDARFAVEEIPPDRRFVRELEAVIEQALTSRGRSSLLFYFSGYAELSDEGEVALALDAHKPSSVALGELRSMLAKLDQAVAVFDFVHAPNEDDPTLSASIVAAAREAFVPKQSGIGLLVAARPSDRSSHVPSPLTHLLLRALERGAPSSGGRSAEALSLSAAYASMREDRELFHELAAAGHFRGTSDFVLLSPPNVVVSDDASVSEPAPRSSLRPSLRPPSEAPSPAESTAEGDALASAGKHDEAIDAYKRALLMSTAGKQSPERAELYYRIGRAKRALGSDAEAVHNFDKALAVVPLHPQAFAAAREILIDQRDFARLERLHRRRLELATTDDGRIAELEAIAKLWQDQAGDDKPALQALEQWIGLRPDAAAYERLIEALDRAGRPGAAVARRKELAELTSDPVRRAQVLTDAARIAQSSLPNKQEAVELARRALDADAGALGALEVVSTLLGKARRWAELAGVYESVLERTRDAPVIWDLAKRLGFLYRDELDDAAGAQRAFTRALEADPSDVELRYLAAELYEAERDHASAAQLMCVAARYQPRNPDVFRRALWAFEKTGDRDAAWCAAAALDQLGEADINESLLADAHRPDALPQVRAALSNEDWQKGLLHPERDRELDELFALIADAALGVAADTLARSKRLPVLDPAARQDPERATVTVARSLLWTARLMGLEPPALYLLPEVEGSIVALPDAERSVLCAKSLASGVSASELAFWWARHLWFHRPEHVVLLGYTSLSELATLLLAALSVGGRQSEAIDEQVEELGEALAERLSRAQLAELEERAGEMATRGLRKRVIEWTSGVHLASARVGLLACGDPELCANILRKHPPAGGIEPEAQIDDLRAYSISAEYRALRARIGVALG